VMLDALCGIVQTVWRDWATEKMAALSRKCGLPARTGH
jgi:hypothetical protein